MTRYERVPGVLLEDLGPAWAAFSPLSGETHLLNDEAALLLECLALVGPAEAHLVAREMATDTDQPCAEVERSLHGVWDQLIEAGMVRAC